MRRLSRTPMKIAPVLLLALAFFVAGCGRPTSVGQVAAQPPGPATPIAIPTPVVQPGPLGSCTSASEAQQSAAAGEWVSGFQIALNLAEQGRRDLNAVVRAAKRGQTPIAAADLSTARFDIANSRTALAGLRPPAAYRAVQRALAAVLRENARLVAGANAHNAIGALPGRARNDEVLAAAQRAMTLRSASLAQAAPRLAACTVRRLRTIAARATATAVARRRARLEATATAVARVTQTAEARAQATAYAVHQQHVAAARAQTYTTRLQQVVVPYLLGASLDGATAIADIEAGKHSAALNHARQTRAEAARALRSLASRAPNTLLAASSRQLAAAAADFQRVASAVQSTAGGHKALAARLALTAGRHAMVKAMARIGVKLILPS